MENNLALKQGNTSAKRAKTFHQKVLQGNIQGAVRYLVVDQEKGGILYLKDTNKKSGNSVSEVPQSKHPDVRMPSTETLTASYPSQPDFVPLNITEDLVESVARHLSGSAGLAGLDSHTLQLMLLRFG
jgi:hypothetical protein